MRGSGPARRRVPSTQPQFEVGDRVFYIGTKGVIVKVSQDDAGYWAYDVELAYGETVRGVYAMDLALHV